MNMLAVVNRAFTSTMTLLPPMMIGVMNTQNMSYRKQSGSRMQATCACQSPQIVSGAAEKWAFLYIIHIPMWTSHATCCR